MGVGFSTEEQSLIAGSFAELAKDMPGGTEAFYRHLFRIAPATQALFVTDLDRQGRKLAQTLATVVDQLDRWGLLRSAVEDLALRHLAYGVRPEHYPPLREALLATFRERLGDGFTPAAEQAWRRLLGHLSETMIAAAYPAMTAEGAD